MKLLLDMNIPPAWAAALRDSGHEAEHWGDIGMATAGDAEVMAHARQHRFVVLTHDLDFGDILAATGGDAPSVVQLRTDGLRFDVIGARVLQALADHAEGLGQGALMSIDLRRSRIRLLPLARR
jgi:predicted nuclease of predicted toxin-antitoxin system